MVNNKKHPSLTLPPFDGVIRKIEVDQPLYDLSDIKKIALNPNNLSLITEKCISNVEDLGWDVDDIAVLISTLNAKDYKDSEWCHVNGNIDRPCDSYVISRREYIDRARKEMIVEYYIKFATNQNGNLLLIVSCHT